MTTNRVALISGASRGIGAAIAERLANEGWSLSLGMRTPVLPAWASEDKVQVVAYDATNADGEQHWADRAVECFGRIDAVISSAGIMVNKDAIEGEDAEFDALMEVNVKAPRRLVKAAWPQLKAAGNGRFVILASLAGKRLRNKSVGMYGMSKFAAIGLAHSIRHAGFEHGIRATAVCPGPVATEMMQAQNPSASLTMTEPDDIAGIVSMLIDLPNRASVAEFHVLCRLEDAY